jgi:hypothetical protein
MESIVRHLVQKVQKVERKSRYDCLYAALRSLNKDAIRCVVAAYPFVLEGINDGVTIQEWCVDKFFKDHKDHYYLTIECLASQGFTFHETTKWGAYGLKMATCAALYRGFTCYLEEIQHHLSWVFSILPLRELVADYIICLSQEWKTPEQAIVHRVLRDCPCDPKTTQYFLDRKINLRTFLHMDLPSWFRDGASGLVLDNVEQAKIVACQVELQKREKADNFQLFLRDLVPQISF